MYDILAFHLLEESNDYKIYYATPEDQLGGIKTGNLKTIYIVVHNDEIVFTPKDYKSQFEGVNKCKEYIESVTKGK